MFDALLINVVGSLFASKWAHWENHWKSFGANYYGDHLLYQRMYEAVDDQIDGIVEKWMVMGKVPDMTQIIDRSHRILAHIKSKSTKPERGSLVAEKLVVKALERAFHDLEAENNLSLGLNDMLAALHSQHETNIYLLTRRNAKNASDANVGAVKVPGVDKPFRNPQFHEVQKALDAGFWGNLTEYANDESPDTPDDILDREPHADELSTLSRLEVL